MECALADTRGVSAHVLPSSPVHERRDCLSCHSASKRDGGVNLSSYSGVMAVVTAGSANSLLVKATQPNGPMYVNLTGSRTTKAQTIYDWVVNSKAAQ